MTNQEYIQSKTKEFLQKVSELGFKSNSTFTETYYSKLDNIGKYTLLEAQAILDEIKHKHELLLLISEYEQFIEFTEHECHTGYNQFAVKVIRCGDDVRCSVECPIKLDLNDYGITYIKHTVDQQIQINLSIIKKLDDRISFLQSEYVEPCNTKDEGVDHDLPLDDFTLLHKIKRELNMIKKMFSRKDYA